MEITQQVRDYAARLNDPAGAGASGDGAGDGSAAPLTEEERQKGMAEMSAKFRALGGEVYVEEQACDISGSSRPESA